MNIIIANKRKEELINSGITQEPYKCATGEYDVVAVIDTLSKIEYDKVFIEESAIIDFYNTATWIKLTEKVPANKIYLYLNAETLQKNYIFLGTVINLGIYNFENDINGLLKIVKKPNALADVEKYRKLVIMQERNKAIERHGSNILDVQEAEKRINEYIKENKNVTNANTRKYNNWLFKVLNGFPGLTIITIFMALCYYFLAINIDNIIKSSSSIYEGLHYSLFNSSITPLLLLVVIIGFGIMMGVYGFIKPFIKKRGMIFSKAMLLPTLINLSIFTLDYYAIGISSRIEEAFALKTNDYLQSGLGNLLLNCCLIVTLSYFLEILIIKMTTIEFEKDLANCFTWFEKLGSVIITAIPTLILLFYVASNFFHNTGFYNTINSIYNGEMVMLFLSVIVFVVMIIVTIFDYLKYRKVNS